MTDTEQKRIEEICKVAHIEDIGELSDGYHTFNQLYYQRMMLFAALVKQNRDKAWKSSRHADGELCFGGGWFIVGIDTPEGSYTYHYEIKYFDLFDCEELECGKVWDGHTEKDVTRLLSLEQEEPCEDAISRKDAILQIQKHQICCYDPEECYPEQCERNVISWLNDLPPVRPTRKKGHWIAVQYEQILYCSECGLRLDDEQTYIPLHYCPNCSAEMRRE